jgi:signal transduction histidine kinase
MLSFGVLLVLVTSTMTLMSGRDSEIAFQYLAVAMYIGSIVLLCINPLLIIVLRSPLIHDLWLSVAVRITLLVTIWLAIYMLMPGWRALWLAPTGAAVGLDIMLTCNSIGWRPLTRRWYRRFLASRFHLGMVGAMIAVLVASRRDSLGAVQVFVFVQSWAAAAALSLWAVGALQHAQRGETDQQIRELISDERRARAHWIHDDVCAQLRLVSLKLQASEVPRAEVLDLLAEFDHQLRLRQLDELLDSGHVRVGEVLQPFIRYAQSHGVRIEGVPAFEQAALALPLDSGRLAARAASVLTSNSLNAGATAVAFDVVTTARTLELTVSDDGPGFDLQSLPAGRGLWGLIDQLGPGSLRAEPREGGGSMVTASIKITNGAEDVDDPAR